MRRTPKIKWTRRQVNRLSAAVRSYNKALGAAGLDPTIAPPEVSYQEMKSKITSAKQLNTIVNRLKRAKRKDAFELVQTETGVTTKYELRETRIAFSVKERRKSMERKARGIILGERYVGSKSLTYVELAPATVKPAQMTQKQRRRLLETEFTTSAKTKVDRATDMYTNYVRAMETVGMDLSNPILFADVKNMVEYAAANEPDFLVWALETYPDELTIDYVYDDQQLMARRAYVLQYMWDRAREEWNESHA
jgi:hypothetical protein